MAARSGEAGYDQLHHLIGAGMWDSTPLENALLKEAYALVGGEDAQYSSTIISRGLLEGTQPPKTYFAQDRNLINDFSRLNSIGAERNYRNDHF